MAHSKRNTSRAVFTSHERALAKSDWATSSARLGRDSFLPFGSCGLCLDIAQEPVACLHGDIFCRECALANILAQKKEIKRAGKARRDAKQEVELARALEDDENRDRAIRDFELAQVGLTAPNTRDKPVPVPKPLPVPVTAQKPSTLDGHSDALVLAGSKRKFALDEDEVSRIAHEDRAKARKAIEQEKAAKPTLPSFWTPSLTPDVQDSKLPPASRKDKCIPICPSSSADDLHPISMQGLVTVHFNEDTVQSSETKRRSCPSCLKTLSNSSKPVMAEQCGHVLCTSCVKLLTKPGEESTAQPEAPMTCYVCETPAIPNKSSERATSKASLPPGFVALRSEGTGFSARGSNTVKKSSIAFQC